MLAFIYRLLPMSGGELLMIRKMKKRIEEGEERSGYLSKTNAKCGVFLFHYLITYPTNQTQNEVSFN